MARPLRATNRRLKTARALILGCRKWAALILVPVIFGLFIPAASAHHVGHHAVPTCEPPGNIVICPQRDPNWFNSGGMTLNSRGQNQPTKDLAKEYNGEGRLTDTWLFDDPALANDPWHFLPMTRWTNVNDFFSTGEGGLSAAFNNVWNASYTTLVAMAFTFASFAWSITVWLVRVMVGAPTLAAEFMSQISERFDKYAGAVMTTGWVPMLLAFGAISAVWRTVQGNPPSEAFKRILWTTIPLALIFALMSFETTVEDSAGETHVVRGPEWLFTVALKLSGYIAEPVQRLTDTMTADSHNAPDQLVTCDAYTVVLEGNFIRAWALKGDHLEQTLQPGGAGGFASAPASFIYNWAETSNNLRMRIAITVSRLWERSYANGYGRAQFGDSITSERAFCIIADWRTRNVSPLEQLAIWRETCFIRAFDIGIDAVPGGSLQLGGQMALTGCSLMPHIKAPRASVTVSQRQASLYVRRHVKTLPLIIKQKDYPYVGKCAQRGRGQGRQEYTGPAKEKYPRTVNGQNLCAAAWADYIWSMDRPAWGVIVSREYTVATPISSDENLDARVYASALFNPSNHLIKGDRYGLRTMHGAFTACEFTQFSRSNFGDPAIERVNEVRLPVYPDRSAIMNVDAGSSKVYIAAEAKISSTPYGNRVRVDSRMWGLGFDGIETGGRGLSVEIVTPDACMAYMFGSSRNSMPDDQHSRSTMNDTVTPPNDAVNVYESARLGIYDKSNDKYKSVVQSRSDKDQFRWDQGYYPPANAWLDRSGSGSRTEYPGANNEYAHNRLGRTPEEYKDSAALWPLTVELLDDNTAASGTANRSPSHVPSLSSSLAGADVFQAVHGRSRAESGIMAILTLAVAISYLLALAGLALGSALSIVILALLIATLPITLLFSALPFESSKQLPKKLLKLGFGASLSYGMFLLFVALVLLAIDFVLSAVGAVEVKSGEFWYTVLLGATPLIALKLIGSLGKHFGVNVTSPKGAFSFTSGMALANMKEPQGGKMKRYGRMGMRGLTHGPMMRGMMGGGAQGGAARGTARTSAAGVAAATGVGAAAGTGSANAASGAKAAMRKSRPRLTAGGPDTNAPDSIVGGGVADENSPSYQAETTKLLNRHNYGDAARVSGQGWRAKAARAISPSERGHRPPGRGRIRRSLSFARQHPALAGAAVLMPFGGIGAAAAFYGASKFMSLTGAGSMARGMVGMPTRGGARGGRGGGDMKALAGGVQKQRSRIAGWVSPAGASPISPVQATGQAQATGQQAEARMVNVGRGQYAPASVVAQAHADGPACGGTTRTTGEPCKLPASICDFSHKKPDGDHAADQPQQSVPEPQQSVPEPQQRSVPEPQQSVPEPQQRSVPEPQQSVPKPQQSVPKPQQSVPKPQQRSVPELNLCGRPLPGGGSCRQTRGSCSAHSRGDWVDREKGI